MRQSPKNPGGVDWERGVMDAARVFLFFFPQNGEEATRAEAEGEEVDVS